MRHKKRVVASAAAFLLLLLVVPQVHLVGAQGDVTNKMSTGMVKQLDAAGPDEIVTAIVKMRGTPQFDGIRGMRGQVFSELRATASMSQSG
ncbi:MAG: hypothetical protein P8181_10300, partial [bacterium]